MVLMVFMLFFGTYLFQVGLIGILIREFQRPLYYLLFYLVLYLVYASIKLVRAMRTSPLHQPRVCTQPQLHRLLRVTRSVAARTRVYSGCGG